MFKRKDFARFNQNCSFPYHKIQEKMGLVLFKSATENTMKSIKKSSPCDLHNLFNVFWNHVIALFKKKPESHYSLKMYNFTDSQDARD